MGRLLLLTTALLIGSVNAFLFGGTAHKEYSTKYDDDFKLECPLGKSIMVIRSHHDNKYEDRTWEIICTHKVFTTAACKWTEYVNDFDKYFNFKCESGTVLAGIKSTHQNHQEDRRFKFKCCPSTKRLSSCSDTKYLNDWDRDLFYSVPDGRLMTGVTSDHSNFKEDRRYAITTCKIASPCACAYGTCDKREDGTCIMYPRATGQGMWHCNIGESADVVCPEGLVCWTHGEHLYYTQAPLDQCDPANIRYGDNIHIVNLYGSVNTYLDACERGGCDWGRKVYTSKSDSRDGMSGTWLIEGPSTGCVRYGDRIHIKNLFGKGTYLDACGRKGSGRKVYTAKRAKRHGNSGTWVIEGKGKGCVKANSDVIHIKNLYGAGTYLDTRGSVNGKCGGGFGVNTDAKTNLHSLSGSWQIQKISASNDVPASDNVPEYWQRKKAAALDGVPAAEAEARWVRRRDQV